MKEGKEGGERAGRSRRAAHRERARVKSSPDLRRGDGSVSFLSSCEREEHGGEGSAKVVDSKDVLKLDCELSSRASSSSPHSHEHTQLSKPASSTSLKPIQLIKREVEVSPVSQI